MWNVECSISCDSRMVTVQQQGRHLHHQRGSFVHSCFAGWTLHHQSYPFAGSFTGKATKVGVKDKSTVIASGTYQLQSGKLLYESLSAGKSILKTSVPGLLILVESDGGGGGAAMVMNSIQTNLAPYVVQQGCCFGLQSAPQRRGEDQVTNWTDSSS
jgi:hypothetical protein